jgi:biotin carboxyl carrier protein
MPAAVAKPVVPIAPPAIPTPASGVVAVTAPTVGKFYAAASPADPPYVQVGSTVAVGSTIGLIEVMKTFTAVKAESAGSIEQILVASGDYVEFGQSLFMLRPSNAS